MKIKSNVRAGSGSTNSGGVNSKSKSGLSVDSTSVDTSGTINNTVSFYVPPVSRCVGI
ncbi:MAG: hypothetical protein JWP43_628 [Ramlibacter sp.]|jgi:hypothetical protein|nr:hypothetical protein [Ramlibacter sp.]